MPSQVGSNFIYMAFSPGSEKVIFLSFFLLCYRKVAKLKMKRNKGQEGVLELITRPNVSSTFANGRPDKRKIIHALL